MFETLLVSIWLNCGLLGVLLFAHAGTAFIGCQPLKNIQDFITALLLSLSGPIILIPAIIIYVIELFNRAYK